MTNHGEGHPDEPNDRVDFSELEESFQLFASGASQAELESAADQLQGNQAALLRRLAQHFSSSQNTNLAADGHTIPNRVGRFEIIREIGSGGFGVVYLARDAALGREVAIKLPRRDLMHDLSRRRQMMHEARTAGALEHPGIIPIYESGCDGETVYVVSSFCDGPDLASWLASRDEPPTAIEAATIVRKLADAVNYAHAQGVVHLDIKPSNVLLSTNTEATANVGSGTSHGSSTFAPLSAYEPKLTDFGLAKLSNEPITDTRSSLIVGTPLYMAPEQLVADLGPITSRTDIYSLGVLLSELLVGKPLLSGKTYVEILSIFQRESPSTQKLIPDDIPRDLRTIINKCLARTPENRFESAAALAADLDAFTNGTPIAARKSTVWRKVVTWCRDVKRTRESCLFTLGAITCMTIWVLYSIHLVWGPTFQGQDYWTPTKQAFGIIFGINLPIFALAFLGHGDRIWAMFLAAMFLLFGSILIPGLIIFDVIGLLDPVYGPYPYFKKSFHSLILLLGFSQFVYLSIGMYAHAWNRSRFSKSAFSG